MIADVEANAGTVPQSGIRNANRCFASVESLTRNPLVLDKVKALLGKTPQLVRAILFDKTPDKNWRVSWHQDRTVAVDRRIALEGWGPWSLKDGVHHVQPPLAVLNQMVTLRVRLDAADEDNGCLQLIPGSHAMGLLDSREVAGIAASKAAYACVVAAGDAVVMRPHILHASGKSVRPGHRRVVHLEFCSYPLPAGLGWVILG